MSDYDIKKLEEIVGDINSEIYAQTGDEGIYLDLYSNSFVYLIELRGFYIWNSDDDNREWITEHLQEDLETHIRNRVDELCSMLGRVSVVRDC